MDNARSLLDDGPFIVINGKLITDINLTAALETHHQKNALATLVLRRNPKHERFSIVETHDGLVTGFAGMPSAPVTSDSEPPLLFTGIQILESRIFDYIPRGRFSHSTVDVYPQAISRGERIAGHVAEGMWYELSTLQRYLDISLALLHLQNRDVYSGKNPLIGNGAAVHDSVLWDNVVVEDGASVRRAVLGDGVRITAGDKVENAILVRAELIAGATPPARALRGEIRGENFVVPLSQ
jgi:NDP-sugar pyrophosphorylase family protein